MSLRTLLRQFQTFGDLILFTSCSDILSRHIAVMANARQKAIQEKRRQGIRPYCRNRTLAPRPIAQSAQGFGLQSVELNSKNEKTFQPIQNNFRKDVARRPAITMPYAAANTRANTARFMPPSARISVKVRR
jgi:hypothetical protein